MVKPKIVSGVPVTPLPTEPERIHVRYGTNGTPPGSSVQYKYYVFYPKYWELDRDRNREVLLSWDECSSLENAIETYAYWANHANASVAFISYMRIKAQMIMISEIEDYTT